MSNHLPSTAASDIISYVRSRCRLGTNPPNAIFQTTQMLVALHDINDWFFHWPMDNGDMAPWKFTRKEKVFLAKNNTTLNGALSAGAISLILTSGTDFDSPSSDAAAAYVKDTNGIFHFFTYEGRATVTLSGINPIDVDLATGLDVQKLYTLPSDYGRPRTLKVNGGEYKFSDSDTDDVPPAGYYHTRFMTSSSGYSNFYLVLPLQIGEGVTVKMHYIKRPTVIATGTDKIDAPNGLARLAIISKFEAYCWEHRGEMDMAMAAEKKAEDAISQFAAVQSGENASPDKGPSFDFGDEV